MEKIVCTTCSNNYFIHQVSIYEYEHIPIVYRYVQIYVYMNTMYICNSILRVYIIFTYRNCSMYIKPAYTMPKHMGVFANINTQPKSGDSCVCVSVCIETMSLIYVRIRTVCTERQCIFTYIN